MAMPKFLTMGKAVSPASKDPVAQINEALKTFVTIRGQLTEACDKIDTKVSSNNAVVETRRKALAELEAQITATNAALATEQARANVAISKLTEIIG